ncbi:MAG: hypothetical protein Q9208_006744 [Pyrenodesmia sp. 3 TL-2023]
MSTVNVNAKLRRSARIQKLSQAERPAASPEELPRTSLITFIRKDDDLPKGWMFDKRKRRSNGDIQELRQYLERINGIELPRPDLPRRASATYLDSSPSNPPLFFSGPQGRVASGRTSFVGSLLEQWRATALQLCWRGWNLRNKVKTSSTVPHGPRMPSSIGGLGITVTELGTASGGALNLLWGIFRDAWRVFRIISRSAWYLLRWQVIVFLVMWACLQSMAVVYTVTSNTFLSSFCQRQLPLVRNWMCSSWDEHQPRLFQNDTMNLNHPFKNILQNRQKSLSYELPHHVAAYEAKIRSFRSSLPESEYAQHDKERFHEKFTDLIGECHTAIPAAQIFHAHIVGTINHHVSDTKYVVKRLENEGFLSPLPMPMPIDGLLVQNMIWLGTHRLLYLPAGIEPLQETSVQAHRMRGVRLMEDHVAIMKRRIEEDIEYQVDQRGRWLETMGPVFDDSVTFVNLAAHELGAAYESCQSLLNRLSYEGRAARYGTEAPEWIKEQAKELEVGIEDLEAQLKGFKLEQLRFNDRSFKRGSSTDESVTGTV